MTVPAITAVSPVQGAASRAAPRPHAPATPAELPDAPKPVTPANAAVHIMKVPSSRVVEAFASLQRAIGQQTRSELPPAAPAAVERVPPLPHPAPPPAIDIEA